MASFGLGEVAVGGEFNLIGAGNVEGHGFAGYHVGGKIGQANLSALRE